MKTLREISKLSIDMLKSRGVSEERLSVEILLAHALGCRRLDLYLDPERPLTEPELSRFRPLLRRRAKHEPIAYILHEREFYGLPFYIDEAVLVPRPETEFLVDYALELTKASRPTEQDFNFADIGTGSGCIAISILKNSPDHVQGFGVEKSEDALKVASKNLKKHDLGGRLQLCLGDLCQPLMKLGRQFDLIVSNPPYIPRTDLETLERGVADFEPHMALLDDDSDGLGTSRKLANQARSILKPGGKLAIECGADRLSIAQQSLEALGYSGFRVIRDYGRNERVLCATFEEKNPRRT